MTQLNAIINCDKDPNFLKMFLHKWQNVMCTKVSVSERSSAWLTLTQILNGNWWLEETSKRRWMKDEDGDRKDKNKASVDLLYMNF